VVVIAALGVQVKAHLGVGAKPGWVCTDPPNHLSQLKQVFFPNLLRACSDLWT
jgi:hypothetical protein